MSTLKITKHMSTDEIITVMENTWILSEPEQVLLERLKSRSQVNIAHEDINRTMQNLDDIISHTRSIEDDLSDIRIEAKSTISSLKALTKELEGLS